VAQIVEHLPGKFEALSSNPNIAKKNKIKNKGESQMKYYEVQDYVDFLSTSQGVPGSLGLVETSKWDSKRLGLPVSCGAYTCIFPPSGR
jgi:hypothetical protein